MRPKHLPNFDQQFGLHFSSPFESNFWQTFLDFYRTELLQKFDNHVAKQYFSKYNNFRLIAQVNWTIFDHFGPNFFQRAKLHAFSSHILNLVVQSLNKHVSPNLTIMQMKDISKQSQFKPIWNFARKLLNLLPFIPV